MPFSSAVTLAFFNYQTPSTPSTTLVASGRVGDTGKSARKQEQNLLNPTTLRLRFDNVFFSGTTRKSGPPFALATFVGFPDRVDSFGGSYLRLASFCLAARSCVYCKNNAQACQPGCGVQPHSGRLQRSTQPRNGESMNRHLIHGVCNATIPLSLTTTFAALVLFASPAIAQNPDLQAKLAQVKLADRK